MRHLLFTACDPAECRQYANVQLNTLPIALFLATALNRTLVLPPFMLFRAQGQHELYSDGGHDQSNAYYRPFSTYFNVSMLQREGLNVIDWPEYIAKADGVVSIDHLLYMQHAFALKKGPSACTNLVSRLLGLDTEDDGGVSMHGDAPVGKLLGVRVATAGYQCGDLDLNSPEALERWLRSYVHRKASFLHELPTIAVLGVWWGSTNHADEDVDPTLLPPPVPSKRLEASLSFNDNLHAEADAFVLSNFGTGGFVSVHWRHGDYTQWAKHAPPAKLATLSLEALRNASVPSPWKVFLATNCKDEGQLREAEQLLANGGASLVRYHGGKDDDPPRVAFLEQLIASRATIFLYSAASFYSQTIVRERRRRSLGPSVVLHGREQYMDLAHMRAIAKEMRQRRAEEGKEEVEEGPMLPGGVVGRTIWDEERFAGASLLAPGWGKVEL